MSKKVKDNFIEEELAAEKESEVAARRKTEASAEEAAVSPDEEAQVVADWEEATDTDQAVPAELAAVHEVESKQIAQREKKSISKVKTTITTRKRSAKYLRAKSQLEQGVRYSLSDAVDLVKKLSSTKFDSAVELHLKLLKKKGKIQQESLKGIFYLPHGTGKEKRIVILDSKKIEDIAKTKKIDFDIAIAKPELMSEVAKIAKILGPKGKMPDPKLGTVVNNPEEALESIKRGKVEYRIDASNNIHQIVGRVSWDQQKIIDNISAVFKTISKSRVERAYICSSMSPAIPLDLASF